MKSPIGLTRKSRGNGRSPIKPSALMVKLAADPLDAQRQLAAWESETIRNLGLDQFLAKENAEKGASDFRNPSP